jgi:hypothetical protein
MWHADTWVARAEGRFEFQKRVSAWLTLMVLAAPDTGFAERHAGQRGGYVALGIERIAQPGARGRRAVPGGRRVRGRVRPDVSVRATTGHAISAGAGQEQLERSGDTP